MERIVGCKVVSVPEVIWVSGPQGYAHVHPRVRDAAESYREELAGCLRVNRCKHRWPVSDGSSIERSSFAEYTAGSIPDMAAFDPYFQDHGEGNFQAMQNTFGRSPDPNAPVVDAFQRMLVRKMRGVEPDICGPAGRGYSRESVGTLGEKILGSIVEGTIERDVTHYSSL